MFAPLLAGIAKADGLISFLSTKVPILGTVFTALTGPIGIVLGVLAGLAVAFTIAYKKSETSEILLMVQLKVLNKHLVILFNLFNLSLILLKTSLNKRYQQ